MEQEKIGGQMDPLMIKGGRPRERRNRYPCTVCTRINSAHCEQCKCDTCQVPEDRCPQCKNKPQDLSQYYVLHGTPQPGENWDRADHFTCSRCFSLWKVKWSLLPKYDKCPRCKTMHYLYPHFTGNYKGCLRGAHKPGINLEHEDMFKCPACNHFLVSRQTLLPRYLTCICGRTFYCFRSPIEKKGLQRLRNLF